MATRDVTVNITPKLAFKTEYKIVAAFADRSKEDLEKVLNTEAADGWRLVAVSSFGQMIRLYLEKLNPTL